MLLNSSISGISSSSSPPVLEDICLTELFLLISRLSVEGKFSSSSDLVSEKKNYKGIRSKDYRCSTISYMHVSSSIQFEYTPLGAIPSLYLSMPPVHILLQNGLNPLKPIYFKMDDVPYLIRICTDI